MMKNIDENRMSKITEALYNISKIIALIAAAIWTIYQWNISIFPKESFEDFKRKAELRTDISISLSKINISSSEEYTPGAFSKYSKVREPFIIEGELILSNNKSFPILYKISDYKIKIGKPSFENEGYAILKWNKITSIPINSIFGDTDSIIIEPGATVKNPFQLQYLVDWKNHDDYNYIEFDVKTTLVAISPDKNIIIPQSKKEKHNLYVTFIRPSFVSDSQLEGVRAPI